MTQTPTPPYVHQPYPSWRYHPTRPAKVVQTAEEDAALGPGWDASPAVTQPKTDEAPAPSDPAVELVRTGTTPANLSAAQVVQTRDQQAAELYATRVADVLPVIALIETVEKVEDARFLELANPKGPRKMILAALDSRRAALSPPEPPPAA